MQGCKQFEARLFYQISLDKLVPENHLVRRLLKKHQTCMEGLFGQAKSQHGLDRGRLRGLSNMHIQGLLTAIVLNVKKLLRLSSCWSIVDCRTWFEAEAERVGFMFSRILGLCQPVLCVEK